MDSPPEYIILDNARAVQQLRQTVSSIGLPHRTAESFILEITEAISDHSVAYLELLNCIFRIKERYSYALSSIDMNYLIKTIIEFGLDLIKYYERLNLYLNNCKTPYELSSFIGDNIVLTFHL